jgi:hypothetical protein
MINKKIKFYEEWEILKDWYEKNQIAYDKSSMWNNLIKDFQIKNYSYYEEKILFRLNVQNGYGFFLAKYENLIFKFKKSILYLIFIIARVGNLIKSKAFNLIILGLGNDNLAYYPLGIRYLKKKSLFTNYARFCKKFNFSIHGAGIKAYYISSIVEKFLKEKTSNLNIMEIGGGLGNLATILNYRFHIKNYLIVDLPDMLLNSSLILHTIFPEIPIYFIHPNSDIKINLENRAIYLCVPESIYQIPRSAFDVAINIDSFQEMKEDQIKSYIELIQQILRNDGYFLNLNRRKFLSDEKFDNNPLLYPYFRNNIVKIWETDNFMNSTFNYNNGRIDSWILKVEKIVK